MAHEGDRISKISGETTVDPYIFRNFVTSEAGDEGNILNSDLAVFIIISQYYCVITRLSRDNQSQF